MIFAPVYQFHIYIYILCLLGLLRDCEIFANLHLKLYLQVRAGDGPHPPLRLAAGLQPGVAGVALRSARPARGLVHQQRVVPRCQHSHHLPHHDQLRLDAGRGHISTQYLHTISTHIYTGRLPPLPAGAPLPAGGPPGAAAAAAGLARTRPLRAALRCLPLLPRGHTTVCSYTLSINLTTQYLHDIHTIYTGLRCASP